MSNLPWLAPAFGLWFLLAVRFSRQLGRTLGASRLHAIAVTTSLGLVLSTTLTPLRGAIEGSVVGPGVCDLSRMMPATMGQLVRFDDIALNIILFVPLGLSLGLLSPTPRRIAMLLGAIVLPGAIELTQMLLPALGRSCESGDVIDNLTGLGLGLGAGLLLAIVRRG